MEFPIVDYISISIPTPKLLTQWDLSYEQQIPFHVDDRTMRLSNLLSELGNWREYRKGGIFTRQISFINQGFNYFEGDGNTSLLQISGQGCDYLRSLGILDEILGDWHDRLTRLDVAIDFICDISPEEFAYAKASPRFKISEFHLKESGITYYVGSRGSDRFARVYRYNPPHPRSNKLRLEYQLSDEQAKLASKHILEDGILYFTEKLGNTFGWTHEIYIPNRALGKAPSSGRKNTQGKTVYWLYKQVLPAIRKCAEAGDLDTLIAFESSIRSIIDEYTTSERDTKK